MKRERTAELTCALMFGSDVAHEPQTLLLDRSKIKKEEQKPSATASREFAHEETETRKSESGAAFRTITGSRIG